MKEEIKCSKRKLQESGALMGAPQPLKCSVGFTWHCYVAEALGWFWIRPSASLLSLARSFCKNLSWTSGAMWVILFFFRAGLGIGGGHISGETSTPTNKKQDRELGVSGRGLVGWYGEINSTCWRHFHIHMHACMQQIYNKQLMSRLSRWPGAAALGPQSGLS